jgi:hypothetical protein
MSCQASVDRANLSWAEADNHSCYASCIVKPE